MATRRPSLVCLLVSAVLGEREVPVPPASSPTLSSDSPGAGLFQPEGAPWKEYATLIKPQQQQQEEDIPMPKGDKIYKLVNRSISMCLEECEQSKREVQAEIDQVNAEIERLEEQERAAKEAALHKAKHEKCQKQAVLLSAQVANLTEMMAGASGSAAANNVAATESQSVIAEQAAMLKEQKERLDELTAALKARNEMTDSTATIQASLEEVKQQLKTLKSSGAFTPKVVTAKDTQKDKTGLTQVYMPVTNEPPDAVTASAPDTFAKGKPMMQ